jgi:hypothetical protein
MMVGTAVALLTAACGGAAEPAAPTSTVAGTVSTGAPPATPPAPDGTTTTAGDSPSTTSDRPLAPDFTLALGDGGSFTLSQETKPVFLVFWAEW